ncbi:MAG: ABC transporter ATP-binding protein [Pseudomonadota bacterium]
MADAKPRSAILRLVAPVRGRIALACALQMVASIAGLVPFIAVAEMARALAVDDEPDRAMTIAWFAAAALAVRLASILGVGVLTHLTDGDLQLLLRRRIASRIAQAPLSWFSKINSGALKKTVQDDFTAFHDIVGHAFTMLVGAACVPIGALLYLAYVDLLLVPAALVPVVIGGGIMASQMKGQGEKMEAYEAAMASVNAAAVEYVNGIAVIKTFSGTGRAFSRFIEHGNAFFDYFWNWVKNVLTLSAFMELILSPPASITIAAGFALLLSATGMIQPIDGFALVAIAPLLTAPFMSLAFAQHNFQQAAKAAERLSRMLDTPILAKPVVPREPDGHAVIYDQVRVTYDGINDVLHNIDLLLEPGTTTALVGPSGSGKSTLARLLPRFLDPSAGTVSIGGVPVNEIVPERLYQLLGFVFQDVRLLRKTVRENIALGMADTDDAAIEAAARLARIHDRIMSLPDGYDTMLGEGIVLSGGEMQRLTIARALLAEAPILVLDEALAFADAETGAALRDALANWTGHRTLLIVAHDLTSIAHADQICVLEAGRVVARGTHSTLLSEDGLYADLWRATEREAAA